MRNGNGFTLIELLAVIIISTTVLVPLLSGLIGNYEVNQRMHSRKAASSITLTTVAAFDKIYFDNLSTYLDDALITEVDRDSCSEFTGDVADPNLNSEEICTMIFDQEWNSIQFTDEDAFKVYIYPYYLTETDVEDILARPDIPDSVKAEIESLETSNETNANILRLSVRIVYDEKTGQSITSSGVVTSE